jgi:uncharacterized metal-binding protein YceD (DUF177 family)
MTKLNNQLDPIVSVNKYSFDIIEEYEINNEKTPWLNDLLVELEEHNDNEVSYPTPSMVIKAQINRKTNNFLKDHLIVKTQLQAKFHLPCGRCLYPLAQELDMNVNAAFLHESMEKMPEYAETTSVFADGQEMELYFFRKGMADIKEFIHEQIYIEVDPFPRCQGECKNPVHF